MGSVTEGLDCRVATAAKLERAGGLGRRGVNRVAVPVDQLNIPLHENGAGEFDDDPWSVGHLQAVRTPRAACSAAANDPALARRAFAMPADCTRASVMRWPR